MQSSFIQSEYAAARIAEMREEACRSELIREARGHRRGLPRFRRKRVSA